MGVFLSMSPILLGIIIMVACIVALILSTAILISAYKAKININVNLSVGSWVLSILTGINIQDFWGLIKSFVNF